MGSTGSRISLLCTQNGEAPFCRLLWAEISERLSSSVPALFAGVNLKRSLSCSFVCEIKKEPTVSFQNDWLRGQQKTAGSVCYYLPSLFFIQLLHGFVSICKGKKPFFHLRIWNLAKRLLDSKKPDKIGLFAGYIFFVPFFWRRRRDSNSRAGFPTYALSRGASSPT